MKIERKIYTIILFTIVLSLLIAGMQSRTVVTNNTVTTNNVRTNLVQSDEFRENSTGTMILNVIGNDLRFGDLDGSGLDVALYSDNARIGFIIGGTEYANFTSDNLTIRPGIGIRLNDSTIYDWSELSSSGNPFNQNLNTTNDVTFSQVTAGEFRGSGTLLSNLVGNDLRFGDLDGGGYDLELYSDNDKITFSVGGNDYFNLSNAYGAHLFPGGYKDVTINMDMPGNMAATDPSLAGIYLDSGLDVVHLLGSEGTHITSKLVVDSGFVANEDSNNVDFRVESDNQDSVLFVEGSNGNVGIWQSSPNSALDIDYDGIITPRGGWSTTLGYDGNDVFYETHSTDGSEGLLMHGDNNGDSGIIKKVVDGAWGYMTEADRGLYIFNRDNDPIHFLTNNITRMNISKSGNVNIFENISLNGVSSDIHIINNNEFKMTNNWGNLTFSLGSVAAAITSDDNLGIILNPASGQELQINGGQQDINVQFRKLSSGIWLDYDAGLDTLDLDTYVTINDVLKLQPTATTPSSPTEGEIYYNSTTHMAYCYNGTDWNGLW